MTDYVPPTYTPISPLTGYVFPSLSNMDYTPPIVQPDDFLSNVFGTDCGTPASTRDTCIAYRTKSNQVFI